MDHEMAESILVALREIRDELKASRESIERINEDTRVLNRFNRDQLEAQLGRRLGTDIIVSGPRRT